MRDPTQRQNFGARNAWQPVKEAAADACRVGTDGTAPIDLRVETTWRNPFCLGIDTVEFLARNLLIERRCIHTFK
jgi:hypothetical protein